MCASSPEVADWVAAENKITFGYLQSIPQRDRIRKRLTEIWNFPQYASPFTKGGRYFYWKNDGLQNQAAVYVMNSLGRPPRVLIDPNTWSKDGTIALGGLEVSDDGRHAAYCRAEAGSDWSTWHVLEVDSGKPLPDELRWTKFTHAAWTKDGRGFFYSRYEEPKPGAEFQSLNFNNKVFYHRLGTAQADDVLVYHRPEHPEWFYDTRVSDDGHYLVITIGVGTDERYRIAVKDLREPYAMAAELIDNFQNEYTFVGNDGPVLYFKTDVDAPRRRLVGIDLRRPSAPHWKEIVPQAEETLVQVSLVGDRFLTSYLQDVNPRVKVFALDGRALGEVAFPGIGMVTGFEGNRSDAETFYTFSSFATPPTIYRYEVATGESTLFRRAEVKFTPDDYEVKQVFYSSKDGTRVPMFLAHKKGIRSTALIRRLLYGYGGFNISIRRGVLRRPRGVDGNGRSLRSSQPPRRRRIRRGMARGGHQAQEAERVRRLHRGRRVADRQHATRGPTSWRSRAAATAGCLVGAVMTQRPELFGACLPGVGVMDMLRFHKFTEGRLWVDDYGSSDDPRAVPGPVAVFALPQHQAGNAAIRPRW